MPIYICVAKGLAEERKRALAAAASQDIHYISPDKLVQILSEILPLDELQKLRLGFD